MIETQYRPKAEGFIAEVKETSLKIMNVEDEEEQSIINRYFSR